MNSRKILMMILVISLVLGFKPGQVLADSRTISGTLSLSAGAVASCDIQLILETSENIQAETVIKAGSSSATYTLMVPEGINQAVINRYTVITPSGSETIQLAQSQTIDVSLDNILGIDFSLDSDMISSLYPLSIKLPNSTSNTIVTPDPNFASEKNSDCTFEPKYTISGTIELPDDRVAPEEGIIVSVGYKQVGSQDFWSTTIKIESGEKSVNYTIGVPAEDNEKGFIVCASVPNYLDYNLPYNQTEYSTRILYYSTKGCTTNYSTAETVFLVDKSAFGVNFQLIPEECYTISGLIKLADNDVAPPDGLMVYVGCRPSDERDFTGAIFKIEAGQNSVSYTFDIDPEDCDKGFIVTASIPDYVDDGVRYKETDYSNIRMYYNSKIVSTSIDTAEPIYLENNCAREINIQLMNKQSNSISGEVRLPANEVAPADGYLVYVGCKSIDGKDFYGEIVKIEAGRSSVSYRINVDPSETSKAFYVTAAIPNYLQDGSRYKSTKYSNIDVYYTPKGSTSNYYRAEPVFLLNKMAENINLELTDKQEKNEPVYVSKTSGKNNAPVVNPINNKDFILSGKTTAGYAVFITKDKRIICKTVANEKGIFSVGLATLEANTVITVYVEDKKGKKSVPVTIKVKDIIPPQSPSKINVGKNSLNGNAEPLSTVVVKYEGKIVATALVNDKGIFNVNLKSELKNKKLVVYCKDKAGNISTGTTIINK